MSIETEPQTSPDASSITTHSSLDADLNQKQSPKVAKLKKRKPKLGSRINMWIRRIHLFSGLFMLPWVLLYGFTALLFNHPTYMAGGQTEINKFALEPEQIAELPSASVLAQLAVKEANDQLTGDSKVEWVDSGRAEFTRQAFGAIENDKQSTSVILDMNAGKGYLRNTTKTDNGSEDSDDKNDDQLPSMDKGLNLELAYDTKSPFEKSLEALLREEGFEDQQLYLRSFPNVEFNAIVDGELVRLRLSSQQSRRRGTPPPKDKDSENADPVYKSKLTIVGSQPRDMSPRSFLLRLHMAHGYPIVTNSRWFWAIAVDLMFASMCFWGLSGVVMWWQIKRTRRIGFILLAASAIVATWLAIGMHWQLVNG